MSLDKFWLPQSTAEDLSDAPCDIYEWPLLTRGVPSLGFLHLWKAQLSRHFYPVLRDAAQSRLLAKDIRKSCILHSPLFPDRSSPICQSKLEQLAN